MGPLRWSQVGHLQSTGRSWAALSLACAAVVCGAVFAPVAVTAAERVHGLSAFGDLKYSRDFKHFDYVNPNAPKGGRLSQIGTGGRTTYNSFNNFLLKGDAAQGLGLIFDSLMVRAFDEPDAVYGLVAKEAELADDKKSVTFYLRPEAKFADGSSVTAEDVAFSFVTLKEKGHPQFRFALKDVTKAEAIDPATIRYTFEGDLTRDLAMEVAVLPILSKAYYGRVDFAKTSLEPPLGSGPYKIGRFKAGTFVTYTRRTDYWGKDLPVNRGRFNFDTIRYEYYRDRTSELQNLQSGTYDLREEFTSKDWATAYDIQAVKEGRLLRSTLKDASPSGAQGFFINIRRDKFKDVRVRQALDLAFDFEWSNKNLFYGLYKRTASFFENSPMKASGPPSPEELALLEPFRDKLPGSVFGEPYVPPVNKDRSDLRANLQKASSLLKAAGWTLTQENAKTSDETCGFFCRWFGSGSANQAENILRNAAGERMDIEFLIFDSSFSRIIAPYIKNLGALGIKATIRRVDPAQYERRVKSFDFDIVTQRYIMRLTPGVELKNYWGARAAKTDGSFNLAGIADPVIDALVDKVMAAKSRAELVTAARAIDRVLRAGHYWIPHWYKASHNVAHWNRFSWPAKKPDYNRAIEDTWWFDPEKAAKLKQN
ncbi:MAG: extracellular solute-binding protein [Alphaproteobacteria bacterium]|nr:extracellular solute-binding protein [Alphaproteobacteria bacterium]